MFTLKIISNFHQKTILLLKTSLDFLKDFLLQKLNQMKWFKPLLVYLLLIANLGMAPKNKIDHKKNQEAFDEAMYFYYAEDWQESLYTFKRLSDEQPDNCNFAFLTGTCMLNIPGMETKSIPYLERASKKLSTTWRENFYRETKAPVYVLFYLGNAYRINNQLDEALKTYQKLTKHPKFEDIMNPGLVQQEIVSCERAKVIRDKPVKIHVTALDTTINNAQSNYRPILSLDGNTLIYMNSLTFYNAIFMTTRVNGKWTEPRNISPEVGSDGDAEPACLSSDAKTLYLLRKKKDNRDIYYSTLEGSTWQNMKPLNKYINSSKDEYGASITPDGKTLYFSSNRKGGPGGYDIFMTNLEPNGEWSENIILVKNINTDRNEINPFISESGKYLFFSSEGHQNMGGYDIFYSPLQADKTWGKPINVGFPINTTGANNYFFPLQEGHFGFLSLFREENIGADDIYVIQNINFEKPEKTLFPEYETQMTNPTDSIR